MPREAKLARALVELADTLVADFDVVEMLTRLADRCVDILDVGAAGLMSPVLAAWGTNALFAMGAVYLLLTVRT